MKIDLRTISEKFLKIRLGFVSIALVILTASLVGYVGHLYFSITPKLANADVARLLPVTSKIVDRNGKLLYEIGGEVQRTPADSKEIPEIIKQATIAVEDKNFYDHPGVNGKAIVRAAVENVEAGRIVEGGSTITQQLVKNTLLSNEQTFERKAKEAFLSLMLEKKMSKDEIITAYLNSVSYGGNIIGIKKAGEVYFDKKIKDLNIAEISTLVSLPKAPGTLSLYGGNRDALNARRYTILNILYQEGIITKKELKTALQTRVMVRPPVHPIRAPHFTLMVRDQLTQRYGRDMVEKGGLTIKTTLDMRIQTEVEKIIANHQNRINGWGAKNAAVVVTDPRTGEILALVGNNNFYNSEIDGQVNIANSSRQPGSSFKPIVYTALLSQEGYSPASILNDVKTTFGVGYSPTNYSDSYHGPVTVRKALAGSLNVPAVQATSIIGVDTVVNLAKSLGINTFNNPERFGYSLGLGAGEVKPIELTGAFSALANKGKFNGNVTIASIKKLDGETLYQHSLQPQQIIAPEVAFQLSHILSDNSARSYVFGANSSLAFPGHQVAVKTGTTSFYKDAWTMGYTTKRTVGVWVGNSDGAPMRQGAAGTFVAAPLFRDVMEKVMSIDNLVYEEFQPPEGVELVTVPAPGGRRVEYVASWQKTPQMRLAQNQNYYTYTIPSEPETESQDNENIENTPPETSNTEPTTPASSQTPQNNTPPPSPNPPDTSIPPTNPINKPPGEKNNQNTDSQSTQNETTEQDDTNSSQNNTDNTTTPQPSSSSPPKTESSEQTTDTQTDSPATAN